MYGYLQVWKWYLPSVHKTQVEFRSHFLGKKVHLMGQEIWYIHQIQIWSFSVWGLVPKEWWLSVVLLTGPEVTNVRMKCAYCNVSLLLRSAFSVMLLGYCEVHYTVMHLIMMFWSMTDSVWYMILYICSLQLGWHLVAVVQYTFIHKQYTEQHNETECTEQNIHNNKNT